MSRGMEPERWRRRLEELRARHDVPAVSLAVFAGGEVTALAGGVLNTGTGVEATTDSLFQIGSITKMFTATLALREIDQGAVELDTPVAEVLPEFRVADPEATKRVTLRHLLTHTSGIDGDFFYDGGRGDDCVARYVDACAELEQISPPGAAQSYCNSGFVILGRVVERLGGTVWDRALARDLLGPLGLAHTFTLPEDVLRFRAATGHLAPDRGGPPEPAPVWSLPRSVGPAGLICATATDLIGFARMHLDGGRAPDGTAVLSPATIEQMLRPQVRLRHPHGMCDAVGLGWQLFDWGGRRVFGHGGDTIGQAADLRVVPDANVAVAIQTNSDRSGALHHQLITELLGELCDVEVPPQLEPPAEPPAVDPDRFTGVYERAGTRLELTARDGRLWMRMVPTGGAAEFGASQEFPLVPLGDDLLLGKAPSYTRWVCYYRYELPDGGVYLHDGARATPRVG